MVGALLGYATQKARLATATTAVQEAHGYQVRKIF
jgi:hypothetical protein